MSNYGLTTKSGIRSKIYSVSGLNYTICLLMIVSIAYVLVEQHLFGIEPCQKCVEIRVWVLCIAFFSLLSAIKTKLTFNIITVCLSFALIWKAYDNVYGEIFACSFESVFPPWFAIDTYMPWLFEVRGLCGQAEGLIPMGHAALTLGAITTLLAMTALLATVVRRKRR
jgi:protein dithiol:quinone oxidoreductase